MHIELTYDDIRLWMQNFLNLDTSIQANEAIGTFCIHAPADGPYKLLPPGYLNYRDFFSIESCDATSVTICIYGCNGSDEVLNRVLVRYCNYKLGVEALEQLPRGQVRLHLDRLPLTRNTRLQSLYFAEEKLILEFADDSVLMERVRMIRMLLRFGYTHVRVIDDSKMGYSGYYFSDDTLDYTLVTEKNPADMRMWASFQVPDWLGLEGKLSRAYFQPSYPNEQVYYDFGNVTFVIPVTIAEPEINAETIARNCERLRLEISAAVTSVVYYDEDDSTSKYSF